MEFKRDLTAFVAISLSALTGPASGQTKRPEPEFHLKSQSVENTSPNEDFRLPPIESITPEVIKLFKEFHQMSIRAPKLQMQYTSPQLEHESQVLNLGREVALLAPDEQLELLNTLNEWWANDGNITATRQNISEELKAKQHWTLGLLLGGIALGNEAIVARNGGKDDDVHHQFALISMLAALHETDNPFPQAYTGTAIGLTTNIGNASIILKTHSQSSMIARLDSLLTEALKYEAVNISTEAPTSEQTSTLGLYQTTVESHLYYLSKQGGFSESNMSKLLKILDHPSLTKPLKENNRAIITIDGLRPKFERLLVKVIDQIEARATNQPTNEELPLRPVTVVSYARLFAQALQDPRGSIYKKQIALAGLSGSKAELLQRESGVNIPEMILTELKSWSESPKSKTEISFLKKEYEQFGILLLDALEVSNTASQMTIVRGAKILAEKSREFSPELFAETQSLCLKTIQKAMNPTMETFTKDEVKEVLKALDSLRLTEAEDHQRHFRLRTICFIYL